MLKNKILIFFLFFYSFSCFAIYDGARSGAFLASKPTSDMFKYDKNFLAKFSGQTTYRTFLGEFSFSKRILKNYSINTIFMTSFKERVDTHFLEASLTRGFTDGKSYGTLGAGYRIGEYGKQEDWLVISTSAGYIPDKIGIETAISYYHSFSSDRYPRLKLSIFESYKIGQEKKHTLSLGLMQSFYVIPSGSKGSVDINLINTEGKNIIEEFIQFELGIYLTYIVKKSVLFKFLFSNVIFLNQENVKKVASDGSEGISYKTNISYAPRVVLSLSFMI
jgi:hypothetical protein